MRRRRLLAVFQRLRFASNIFSLPAQIINDGTVRLPRKRRRIQEDNGWPNVGGRANMGLGGMETLTGGRKARTFELGSPAFVGQLRTFRSIQAPPDPQNPNRRVVDCWGLGIDTALHLTSSIGIQG
jgi:hypothetical protein